MSARPAADPPADPFAARDFQVEVCARGYVWREAVVRRHRPWLDGRPEPENVLQRIPMERARRYQPLAVPEIFRIFAQVPTSWDGISRFAAQYGQLGVSVDLDEPDDLRAAMEQLTPFRGYPPEDPIPPNDTLEIYRELYKGEPQSEWVGAINEVRSLVRLWDALRSTDLATVREYVVQWSERPKEVEKFVREETKFRPRPADWLFITRADTGWVDSCSPPQDLGAATRWDAGWTCLRTGINHRLYDHCAPQLARATGLVPTPRLQVLPKNLLGAICWQFARAVTGSARYEPCIVCGQLMELSTGIHGARADKVFCSIKCKFRKQRDKIREARKMRAAGRSIREIAAHFQTKVTTVKRWLTTKQ